MRGARSSRLLLGAVVGLACVSACAQILGDDFVVVDDDDDDDGTSSGGCDGQGNCEQCVLCGCAHETDQCFVNNAQCASVAECVSFCADADCVNDCALAYPDGVDDYNTWNDCGCYNACPNDCAMECSS